MSQSGIPPAAPQTAQAPTWRSPSSLALIAANLIPVYGVVALDWPVFPLMLLFWLENVAIGALNVARILCAQPGDYLQWFFKVFLVPFFVVHYGGFCFGHGVFVFALFGPPGAIGNIDSLESLEPAADAIFDAGVLPALVVLAASHLFSFFANFLGRGEYQRTTPEMLMLRPYARIVVLHLVLIAGGALTAFLKSPLWALLMLVAMKIGVDLHMHLAERRRLAVTEEPAAARAEP